MARTRDAAGLPPVTLSCTDEACGHQFLTRAARHTVLRCPQCRRAVRVKRPRPLGWRRKPVARHPAVSAYESGAVCQESTPATSPPPGPVPAIPPPGDCDDGQDDDDGFAYMLDDAGTYVLADLTPDGRLVPVRLAEQRFRLIASGYCSVYGCTNGARHLVRGWPVCPDCRWDLAGIGAALAA
jgi:hypothetical protein